MSKLIAYGAMCTWWEDKDKVATKPSGLPCCPHCGGVLFEVDKDDWFDGAAEYEEHNDDEGYVERMNWVRGKCFPIKPGDNIVEVIRENYNQREQA